MLIVISLIALAAVVRLLYAGFVLWRAIPRSNEDFSLLFDRRRDRPSERSGNGQALELLNGEPWEVRHG